QDGGAQHGKDGGGHVAETSFRWQCVEQPIGQRLFRRFLEREEAFAAAAALWAALEELERCEKDERGRAGAALRERFMAERAERPCGFLSAHA
ncbi:RK kinase, partial [Crotophaga sulcirostris]|nr:RK kinase [Crotophaga sulcirostris]